MFYFRFRGKFLQALNQMGRLITHLVLVNTRLSRTWFAKFAENCTKIVENFLGQLNSHSLLVSQKWESWFFRNSSYQWKGNKRGSGPEVALGWDGMGFGEKAQKIATPGDGDSDFLGWKNHRKIPFPGDWDFGFFFEG